MKQKPLFISFEGCEGCGKSTQSKLLQEWLSAMGIVSVLTREPGGTVAAEKIRSLILDQTVALEPKTQLLLHFAARREHVTNVILPALSRREVVICDRFTDSTMAYQAYGSGLNVELVSLLSEKFLDGVMPDLTFVLEMPVEIALQRASARRQVSDRYESLPQDFHQRVASGFSEIARLNPERCVVINADQDVDYIAQNIQSIVTQRLN